MGGQSGGQADGRTDGRTSDETSGWTDGQMEQTGDDLPSPTGGAVWALRKC